MRMHTEAIFDLGKNEHMTGPTHILYQIIDFVLKIPQFIYRMGAGRNAAIFY